MNEGGEGSHKTERVDHRGRDLSRKPGLEDSR